MIISEEQAKLAAQDLRHAAPTSGSVRAAIDPDLFDRVRDAVQSAPDMRTDRIEEARCRLGAGCPDAGEVASKMISRILSDSLR